MISVVIPLYNKEAHIENTIKSVLNQSFQKFEIIIVDDGSTDNSISVVRKFSDSRIHLVQQTNAGVSAARNRGIKEAKYNLIAFLDADDEWMPEYLETQYNLSIKYPECSVFACNYEFHSPDGKISKTHIEYLPFTSPDGIINNYFKIVTDSHPPVWTSATMVKTEAIKSIGGFPAGVTLGEDLITWAKLACKYKIAYSRIPVAIYNFRSQIQLVTPRRAPDKTDIVGREFDEIYKIHGKSQPALNEYIALWHKMRMVTFVRLNMKTDANIEYDKIKRYIKPDKKTMCWHILNYLPYKIIRFILLQIARLK